MTLLKRKRVRIELLDVAKAITVFLVIVGHTTSNTDTIMYRRVLYAFHMPLFFFLAGMSRYMDILVRDVYSFLKELVYDLCYGLLISRDGMR